MFALFGPLLLWVRVLFDMLLLNSEGETVVIYWWTITLNAFVKPWLLKIVGQSIKETCTRA